MHACHVNKFSPVIILSLELQVNGLAVVVVVVDVANVEVMFDFSCVYNVKIVVVDKI